MQETTFDLQKTRPLSHVFLKAWHKICVFNTIRKGFGVLKLSEFKDWNLYMLKFLSVQIVL